MPLSLMPSEFDPPYQTKLRSIVLPLHDGGEDRPTGAGDARGVPGPHRQLQGSGAL